MLSAAIPLGAGRGFDYQAPSAPEGAEHAAISGHRSNDARAGGTGPEEETGVIRNRLFRFHLALWTGEDRGDVGCRAMLHEIIPRIAADHILNGFRI